MIFVISYSRREARTTDIAIYKDDQEEEATKLLHNLENAYRTIDDKLEVCMLCSDSWETLMNTHARYFM